MKHICKKCGQRKTASEFYIYKKTGKLRPKCKDCLGEQTAEWNRLNPEKRKQISKRYVARHPEKVMERRIKYYEKNKDHLCEKQKIYRKDNLVAVKRNYDNWRFNNPEKAKKASDSWKERHKERSRELSRLSARNWKKNNPAKAREQEARREAKKRHATPSWADKKAMLVFYEEAQQMTKETGILHHVDHIIPLNSPIVCGLHCEFNLQVLPYFENISKGNRRWPDMPL